MALIHSKFVRGPVRIPAPDTGNQVAAVRYHHTLATGENVTNNIVEMGVLPAGCRIVDAIVDADDLDGGTAMLIDVGLMTGSPGEALDADGNARTCGDEILDGSNLGQAGGRASAAVEALRVAPVGYDRSIGIKIATQAGTAAEGEIGITLMMAAG